VVSSTPRPQFTPGKDQVPIVLEANYCINIIKLIITDFVKNLIERDSVIGIALATG